MLILNYGHYDIVSLFFSFLSLLCVLKVNAMIIYISFIKVVWLIQLVIS